MKLLLALLLVAVSTLHGANPVVSVIGATSTQIALSVVYSGGALTITVTDNNNGPSVHDVDPTLFAGANLDTSRTAANGFRWHTIVNGTTRIIVLGGHGEIKLGLDGKYYTTDLQCATDHTITLTNGSDTATVHVSTSNIPLGSYAPELPIPTPGSPLGGMPQPTVDWSRAGRSTKYIDRGIVVQRVTGGDDNFDDTNPFNASFLPTVLCADGTTCAAWTTPNNLITNKVSSTLATTSTTNSYAFAAFSSSFSPPGKEYFSDILVTPYGSSTNHTEQAEFCLSTDSGQTCANYTPQDVTYGTSTAQCQPSNNCTVMVPGNTPSPNYSGWGGMAVAFGNYDLANLSFSNVSASGSVVSMPPPGLGIVGFNLNRIDGTMFSLTCPGPTTTFLTVLHVDTYSQITVKESGLSLSNCTYQDYAVGIRGILKTTGTVHVSIQAQGWAARSADAVSNGAKWICARSKVTNIAKDCDGVVQSPPISGYLCGLAQRDFTGGIYLLQDNGRMCQQSAMYGPNGTSHLKVLPSGEIPPIGNNTFVSYDFGGSTVWKMTFSGTDYTEFAPDPTHTHSDHFTYTNLTASASPLNTQIAAAGGPVAAAIATGAWPSWSLDGVIDNGSGGATLQYRTGEGQNKQCMLAWTDATTNLLISANTLYGGYPNGYAPCHFATQGSTGYSLIGSSDETQQLSPAWFNSSVLLGGPFTSNVTAMGKNGSMVTHSITISTCTKAPIAVCTATNHDIDQVNAGNVNSGRGVKSVLAGATSGWTGLNGTRYLHYLTTSTFSVYTNSTGTTGLDTSAYSGAFSGSVTATVSPAMYSIYISAVTPVNIVGAACAPNCARITGLTADGRYTATYGSGSLVVQDADPIAINTTQVLNSTTQYYAKASCAGCSANQFDIYSDAVLTTPVPFATLSSFSNNGFAVYAEPCPSQGSVTLPGPMYTDTTAWTAGGTPKVRCAKLRLDGDFLSDYPKSGEATAYPASGTGNSARSMMHQINVGDGLAALRGNQNDWEIDYVLSVDRTNFGTNNQIDVVVARNYGDDINYNWRGWNNRGNYWSMQHAYGWTAWAANIVKGYYINSAVSPNTYAVGPLNSAHSDFVPGAPYGTGKLTAVSGYAPGTPDDQIDVSLSTFVGPSTTAHNSFPAFSTSPSYSYTLNGQSYPNFRCRADQASPTCIWKADWMAINTELGFAAQNQGAFIGLSSTLTNIRGTTYDVGNATTIVYKIPVQSAVNIKITPLLVTSAPHTYFQDKSGPSSLIVDADAGKYCEAYVAGECRPNSVAGDVFIAGRQMYQAFGQCIVDDATLGSPCAMGLWPGAGWAVQVRTTPIDTNGSGVRRLTQGFWLPLTHYSFSNWTPSPDGKWGFFASNPVQQRPRKGVYEASQWFAMKLPPFPSDDGVNRTTFRMMPVAVIGNAGGDTVRVGIGYGQFGVSAGIPPCTTRNEACWTTTAATVASPFVFASETQGRTACDPSCTVNVPLLPNNLGYIRVEHLNGATSDSVILDTFGSPPVIISGPSTITGGRSVIGGSVVLR